MWSALDDELHIRLDFGFRGEPQPVIQQFQEILAFAFATCFFTIISLILIIPSIF